MNLSQARNQYEIARKHLDDLQGVRARSGAQSGAAQRDQAKGRHDAAQAQLSYSRITSPIDGVVTDRPVYAGETPPSGSPVVTVMDISQVIARAHVSQAEAAELKVGNDAESIGPDGAPIAGEGHADQPGARSAEHDGRSLGPGAEPRRQAAGRARASGSR